MSSKLRKMPAAMVLWVTFLMLLVGCDATDSLKAAFPIGIDGGQGPCKTAYYDADLGIGLTPPVGFVGPIDAVPLFDLWLEWRLAGAVGGSDIRLVRSNPGEESLEAYGQRRSRQLVGDLMMSESTTLANGRPAWINVSRNPTGGAEDAGISFVQLFTMRDGAMYAITVTGAGADGIDNVDLLMSTAKTLCVD